MRPGAAAPRPLTEEEKKMEVARYLQQKREQFAINILCNMVQGAITNKDVTNVMTESLVGVAVDMADHLIEKLYPLKQDKEEVTE